MEGRSSSGISSLISSKMKRDEAAGVVVRLPDHASKNFKSYVFQRHNAQNGSSKYIYAAKIQGTRNDRIVLCGEEEKPESEGCKYVLALVDKTTRKRSFVPIKLVNVSPVPVDDYKSVIENRIGTKVDYSLDFTIDRASWAEKRRALTSEFGSSKRMKVQEAADRRVIKDEETLSIMMASAFASPNVTKKEGKDIEKEHISLIKKAKSSVLPNANESAKIPRDVYSFSIFLSEADIVAVKSGAFEYLNRKRKELLENGFSEQVYRLLGTIAENTERACYVLLLDAMVRCYKIVAKKRWLMLTDWASLDYPTPIMTKLQELFFSGEFQKDGKSRNMKLAFSTSDKDRLLSHVICLAVILDSENLSLPITPWAKELGTTEMKIGKVCGAIGCSVTTALPAEGIRLGTTRIARLSGPPQSQRKAFMPRPSFRRRT